MWKSKKVVLMTLLAIAVIAGSAIGIAAAQEDGTGDDNPFETRYGALMDKVCGIYQENTGVAIDAEQLKNAFAQAQGVMAEEAMQNRIQGLVDEGKMTQGEADEYLQWWQAMPDTLPDLGVRNMGPGGFGKGGFGRGGMGPGGFGGRMHCNPDVNLDE